MYGEGGFLTMSREANRVIIRSFRAFISSRSRTNRPASGVDQNPCWLDVGYCGVFFVVPRDELVSGRDREEAYGAYCVKILM